jgi:ribosomal protein L11 methyltransferase
MPWLQLELRVADRESAMAEVALEDAGALAVTLRDAGDCPVLEPEPGETPIWPDLIVTGLFPGETDPDLAEGLVKAAWSGEDKPSVHAAWLEDRTWEREWELDFRPMRFGDRLWVCPTDEPVAGEDAVCVRLSPGLAFGTGTHPTTALCLEWLDGLDLAGRTVLDYGCGSGILAVAAACLGAGSVFATDTDPQALSATRANAESNGVANRIQVVSPEALGDPQCEILVANILANPLISLAPVFRNVMQPGGKLALSGILEAQVSAVATAYAPWFTVAAPTFKEEWARLVGTRLD